jgi:hypothetical protein
MNDKLREWSKAERTAGEKVSDTWQKFFQAERKDAYREG